MINTPCSKNVHLFLGIKHLFLLPWFFSNQGRHFCWCNSFLKKETFSRPSILQSTQQWSGKYSTSSYSLVPVELNHTQGALLLSANTDVAIICALQQSKGEDVGAEQKAELSLREQGPVSQLPGGMGH